MTIVETLIPILILVVGFITIRAIFGWLLNKATKTKTLIDDNLLLSLRGSLYFMWFMLALGVIVYFIKPVLNFQINPKLLANVILIIGVITVDVFLLMLVNLQSKNIKPNKFDASFIKSIANLAKFMIVIISGLVILQNLGVNTSGLLAFGSVGGLTVGFASKDLLANIFGGLTIYLDKPFKTGDWIRSPDREIEGTVEKIAWRWTIIRTFDKRPLYVPNSLFLNLVIENPSRMQNRRIYETIGLRYQDVDKLTPIINEIKNYLANNPDIDKTETLMVNFNKFADSSLDIFVYCFCKTTDWEEYHLVKDEILQKIYQIIQSNSARIAYPTTTLKLPEKLKF